AGVDPLDPKSTEIPLLVATITIRESQRFLNFLNRYGEAIFGTAAIALRQFDDLFVASVCSHCTSCFCHFLPPLKRVWHIISNSASVNRLQNHGPPLVADLALASLAHVMLFVRLGGNHLAGRAYFEAFLGAAFCFHLWHFNLLRL